MISVRSTATSVGLLFVTTMVAGIIDSVIAMPILRGPLAGLQPQRGLILTGVFLVLYMSLGVVLLALLLYPILKRHSNLIASAYVAFRVIEACLLILGAVASLLMLEVSRRTPAAPGSGGGATFGDLSALAFSARMLAYQVAMTILGFNGLAMCCLLHKARLVPRAIADLGVVGYALLALSAVLAICGVLDTSGAGALLYAPGGLFELLVFPAWLIGKGFRTTD